MKIASMFAGALALGGGLVKFFDIAGGSTQDSYTAATALCLLGILFLVAGFIGNQKQK